MKKILEWNLSWRNIQSPAVSTSPRRAIHNQILNPHQLYDFAKREIPHITCFFVDKQQVNVVSKFLTSRYENARQFRGSRKIHQFIPNGDNILMSRISGEYFPVSNLTEHSPASTNIEEHHKCFMLAVTKTIGTLE